MHTAGHYCVTRKDLEDRTWVLVSELSNLTTQLCVTAGRDHAEFFELQCRSVEAKAQLSEARYRLAAHCKEHGC